MGFAEVNSHTVSGHWFDWAQLGSSEAAAWLRFFSQRLLDVVWVGESFPKPPVRDI